MTTRPLPKQAVDSKLLPGITPAFVPSNAGTATTHALPVPGLVADTCPIAGDPVADLSGQGSPGFGSPSVPAISILRRIAGGRGAGTPVPPRPRGHVGLPPRLRANVEALSGISLEQVSVHYDSARPATLAALAYTRGSDIFLGPGQERHLPHEAWHVVQQVRGSVRTTDRTSGYAVNDDQRLEREADVMGERTRHAVPRGSASLSERTVRDRCPADSRDAPIQMVKQPPVGNFARYVNAMVTNSGVTAPLHPNDAEVATESKFQQASAPANSYGWAALQPNNYMLTLGVGAGNNTTINIDPMVDMYGNHLYRMHLVHHELGSNTNGNVNNIVLGPAAFNLSDVNRVENFLKDSMEDNFYTSANHTSLAAALVVGEATGIAPPAHVNAGAPYVVGNPPVFPAGLLTGNVLVANNGVPANAHEITMDHRALNRFVTLWYFAQPVFGSVAANVYNNLRTALGNHYLNSRPGAVKSGESIPNGILAPGMLQNIANALAGIYATSLVVEGSFFTPEPTEIPGGGSTANLLPWRDNRWPARTLQNVQPPHVWIQMTYQQAAGVMANSVAAVVAV